MNDTLLNIFPNLAPKPAPKAFRADSFASSYTLTKILGEGGYGKVYTATHNTNNTHHAVKIIPILRCKHTTYCPVRDSHVPTEVAIWEPLDHPGVVKLQDVFFDSYSWILVMDYDPEFVDLFYHIDVHGVMTSAETAHIIKQLLDIIFHLALQGVDHRDIKDENILYNPRTKLIKIIDFGSASPLTTEEYRSFQGTDVYVPPEFWNDMFYYPFPATVWSVGCLAFILLNGDCPFANRDEVKDFDGDIEKLSTFTAGDSLGEIEGDFISGCLRPDHQERPTLPQLVGHKFLDWVFL